MTYTWDIAAIGDTAHPAHTEISDQQIADYCRAVRYENLVYTNQPAARELGLPGIVAPPAMALAFAMPRPAGVAAARGFTLPPGLTLNPVGISVRFQGLLVTHGDTITAQTSLTGKGEKGDGRFLTFTVTAHNQNGELVAEYEVEYLWEGA